MLKCTKTKVYAPKEKDSKASTSAAFTSSHGNRNDQSKYEQYFNFENGVRYVKPHQVLAINRGEKSKFLSVKVIVPDYFKIEIKRYIRDIFLCDGISYSLRNEIFEKAFEECYTKKRKLRVFESELLLMYVLCSCTIDLKTSSSRSQ